MRNEEVLSLLARGLEAAANEHTVSTLGDRRSYLGMSDLARGLSCPRGAIASKLAPDDTGMTLGNLLQLRRGHWLEYGIEEALSALNTRYISQLEISIQHQGVPVKAHLDLVLPDESSQSVTVLELKSIGHLRDQVYGSHEAQLYGQLGLLHRFWNQPIFSVARKFEKTPSEPACSESCSFPELAHRQLKIQLAKDVDSISIQGYVLTASPKAAKAFGPYSPNGAALDGLLKTGQELWQRLTVIKSGRASLSEAPYQRSFDPLCDWCRHNQDCPKFDGPDHFDLEPELTALAELKRRRTDCDAEIKEREAQLKAIADLMGLTGKWINTANYRFKVSSQTGRMTVDPNVLKANLHQLKQIDRDQLTAAWDSAQKLGKPFDRLHLSPINH